MEIYLLFILLISIYRRQNQESIIFALKMGQQQSIPNSLANNSNWKEVKNDGKNIFHNVNPYSKRIFLNIVTKEYVEEYELEFISELDYSSFQREVEMRRELNSIIPNDQHSPEHNLKISPYIYRVKGILNVSSEDLCSALHRVLLYAEKVDLRLRQINDLPFADQLYLTQATLEGFKSLYQNVGYFDIIEEMIFINRKGKVKVWMNPNLANHQPYIMPKSQKRQQRGGSQSQMIINLLSIIENNIDDQANKIIHFKHFLVNRGTLERLSFYKALEEFRNYCLENRLCVPKFMVSIKELYEEDDNQSVGSVAQRSEVIRVSVDGALNFMGRGSFSSQPNVIKKGLSPSNIIYNKPLYDSKISQTSYKSFLSNQSNHNLANQPKQKKVMAQNNSSKMLTPAFRTQQLYYSHIPINQDQKRVLFRQGSPPQIHLSSPVNQAVNQINQPKFNPLPQPSPIIIRNFIKKPQSKIHEQHIGSAASIKFNYGSPVVKQMDQILKMETPQFKMFHSFPSEKTNSDNDTDRHCEPKSIEKTSNINYYSPNQTYQLDQQIAEDLKRFFAFSLNP